MIVNTLQLFNAMVGSSDQVSTRSLTNHVLFIPNIEGGASEPSPCTIVATYFIEHAHSLELPLPERLTAGSSD